MSAAPDRAWLEGLFVPPAAITLLSGESGCGKTLACLRALDAAQSAGWTVRGVLSPGRYDEIGARTGIDLLDPASGTRWPLAVRAPGGADAVTGLGWQFSPEGMARGTALLAESGACDLLIVDEIGPLELRRDEGWIAALDVLRAGRYARALVVVRPGLIDALAERLAPLPVHVLRLPLET
ncbi:MAG: hypothetical protein JW910_22995 [Anaerolineae bacterium]|nr:hypothetical protein [Anaerolineae bacterium]